MKSESYTRAGQLIFLGKSRLKGGKIFKAFCYVNPGARSTPACGRQGRELH